MKDVYHIPALFTEALSGLRIKEDGVYVDCTFGGGGHSRGILEKLGERGKLYSFDADIEAFEQNKILDDRWHCVNSNFRFIKEQLDYTGETQVDGILADLGVSFHHFNDASRGFSFRHDSALDMRMNQRQRRSAREVINESTRERLAEIFSRYGEIRDAVSLAGRIKKYCVRCGEMERVGQLVEAAVNSDISSISPIQKKYLAKVFQALRIEVNDELGSLEALLLSLEKILKSGGYVAIISYHSLEDRLVKNVLTSGNLRGEKQKDFYGNLLAPFEGGNKVITPTAQEVEDNPQSRSAKLRIAKKI